MNSQLGTETGEIQKEILRLLNGQTYGSAKEILNYTLESLEYNSIVEKENL